MTKQLRYGTAPTDKVRVASVTRQQIDELTEATGLTQQGVMQEAISRLYSDEIIHSQQKRLVELQAAYDELYKAHCDAINS